MENEKASWIFYQSWEKSVNLLSLEERGKLLTNLINYHKGGEVINDSPMLEMFWNSIEYNLDRNTKRYLASVENGKKGGAPKGNQNALKQPNNNLTQPNNNLNDNVNVNGNVNKDVNDDVNGNVDGYVNDSADVSVNVEETFKNFLTKNNLPYSSESVLLFQQSKLK
jgi:hypothetical protein